MDGGARAGTLDRLETILATAVAAASYIIVEHVPEIEDPRLSDLLQYWRTKRRGRPVPAFKDIDPIEIPSLLTYLWIHDYDPENDRFRVRLMGEAVRSTYDCPVVGVDVEELVTHTAYPVVAERYRTVLTMPAIGHGSGRIYGHTIGRVGGGERLYLPLADEDGRTRMILGATIYKLLDDPQEGPEAAPVLRPDTMSPVTRV